MGEISNPEPLKLDHDYSSFTCGEITLDDWLKQRAFKNQRDGATRTYVVCNNKTVIGYYSLAVGAVAHNIVIGKIKRNMPDPIPVMVLARLAVDTNWQGKCLGSSLLQDTIARTLQAAEIAGIRAILVHVISDKAKRFYQYFGFQQSPIEPKTLMARLIDLG